MNPDVKAGPQRDNEADGTPGLGYYDDGIARPKGLDYN